ncbi:MAG: AAA family ATPase, partial [Tannerella sp.]|nr:AAA family ATPase [Tannerella sp.]
MEQRIIKKLPYGTSNFEKLVTEDYYFVDKTRYIEYIENEQNNTVFFTRPRKFGKSLFLSMLSYYYDVLFVPKFDTLFGDLYIGKHPTKKKNSFLVIKFNFSGLDTSNEEDFKKSFSSNIRQAVLTFIEDHRKMDPIMFDFRKECMEQTEITNYLNVAFRVAKFFEYKLYIIIDEYDHFANDLIAMGSSRGDEVYHNMIHANGVVRDFYETLKSGSETVIDRILLTGITPIMLDDMTSGFNIANNISIKPKYNEILGFTQTEVDKMIDDLGLDRSLINVNMEYFYNGYKFHDEGEHRVYNSSMVLFYFTQILENNSAPRYLIDDNLKTDYGRLRRLIQTDENRQQLVE